jgi:hypothetical protein
MSSISLIAKLRPSRARASRSLWLVVVEALPRIGTGIERTHASARFDCLILATSESQALTLAREHIDQEGWSLEECCACRQVSRRNLSSDLRRLIGEVTEFGEAYRCAARPL